MTTPLMAIEMAEQPRVLTRLASRIPTLAAQVRELTTAVSGVAFLARGSSDHAGLLGRYAVELYAGLPTCLIAPSMITAFHRKPSKFAGWLVVALSQSGRTPEIITSAQEFLTAGATLLAITNDDRWPLADLVHLTIGLDAGPEHAVPATKTVTAQMLAVLALTAGLAAEGAASLPLTGLPNAVDEVLADTTPVAAAAERLASFEKLTVIGRGLCYAAAESALKLQETTGMLAHRFSTADFRHGPIAVSGPRTPAVLLAGSGPADDDTLALRESLSGRRTPTVLIGCTPEAEIHWPRLGAMECLLATVRGQQLAYAICVHRGIDPDRPRGLNKVTLTH